LLGYSYLTYQNSLLLALSTHLETIRGTAGIRGIIHAAGVLEDGMLAGLTAEQLERVTKPKIDGAWNLHEATANDDLEFFVLFSVQYFIVLLDLKAWQWWIYGFFALSIVWAWLYAKKERGVYERNNALFEERYEETLKQIEKLEEAGYLKKSDLIIETCDEHI